MRFFLRRFSTCRAFMSKSKYEYVKKFEREDILLPNTWIVIRIDGRGFHKCVTSVICSTGSAIRFSKEHDFRKPNDGRALHLINKAAGTVMLEYRDVVLGYGESDEFRYVPTPEQVNLIGVAS